MDDIITIEECITRLDAIRNEIVSNSRDHFALSAGIAALYEMEKNAPAVNRWISVEDALPDKKQKVLVFYKAIGEKNNIHNDVIATNWRKENGDFIPFEGYKITHWMPLPEPPESEVHGDAYTRARDDDYNEF